MKPEAFRKEFQELRKLAQGRDALWNDWANDPQYQNNKKTGKLLGTSTADLQDRIEALIRENELTPEQVAALGNIVYQTPGYKGATDVNVGRIDVLRPFTGFFTGADKALGTFTANLLGLGYTQIQGPKTGYMPVRIERPKITDKK